MNDARNETIPRKWPSDQDRPRQTKISSLISSWMWPPFPNSPSNKKETEANLNAYWKTKENGPPSVFSSLSFTGSQYFSWKKKKKRTASLCSSLARLFSPQTFSVLPFPAAKKTNLLYIIFISFYKAKQKDLPCSGDAGAAASIGLFACTVAEVDCCLGERGHDVLAV